MVLLKKAFGLMIIQICLEGLGQNFFVFFFYIQFGEKGSNTDVEYNRSPQIKDMEHIDGTARLHGRYGHHCSHHP